MKRKILKKIAKAHGVTVEEVERDMQSALDYTYKNTRPNGVTEAYQARVVKQDEVPTPDEFIRYAVGEVNKRR